MAQVIVKSIQGKRDYMEDYYNFFTNELMTIAMICDGHGGFETAHLTSNILPALIYHNMARVDGDDPKQYAKALRDAIILWGEKCKNMRPGTTCTGFVKINGVCYVFNIGDSRTSVKLKHKTPVYCLLPDFDNAGKFHDNIKYKFEQFSFFTTIDHNNELKFEVNRVINSGGHFKDDRLNGILSLTRAIGDNGVGLGITFIPEVYWFNIDNIDGPIIMYSDGIYENPKYTPDRVYQMCANYNNDIDRIMDEIIASKTSDNLTIMIIEN